MPDQTYSSLVDLWRSGERETVAEVILRALNPREGTGARRALGKIGLQVEHWADPDQRVLLVANQHVGLDRLFRETRWAGGNWRTALRYLDGAAPCGRACFAGVQQRATLLPSRWLPGSEPDREAGEVS